MYIVVLETVACAWHPAMNFLVEAKFLPFSLRKTRIISSEYSSTFIFIAEYQQQRQQYAAVECVPVHADTQDYRDSLNGVY